MTFSPSAASVRPLTLDKGYTMTDTASNTAALRVFIGLYIAPACGQWVTVDADTDPSELHEIGAAIAAKHGTEEYAIFDTDGGYGLIGESTSFDTVCALGAVFAELDDEQNTAFRLWLGNDHYSALKTPGGPDADALLEAFRDDYQGAFDKVSDWAEQYVEECCSDVLEGMGEMARYFDFASFAHDAERGGDIWTARAGGQVHVFTSN